MKAGHDHYVAFDGNLAAGDTSNVVMFDPTQPM